MGRGWDGESGPWLCRAQHCVKWNSADLAIEGSQAGKKLINCLFIDTIQFVPLLPLIIWDGMLAEKRQDRRFKTQLSMYFFLIVNATLQ